MDCKPETVEAKEVATYVYRDKDGAPLYEKVRYEPKDFRIRRYTEGGGVAWGMGDEERVLYNLPDIVANPKKAILFVEGEKSCDLLKSLGFLSTCSPFGAAGEGHKGKWSQSFSESLRGRVVFIFPDNDPPGEAHAQFVEKQLTSSSEAMIVRLKGLLPKEDIYDWCYRDLGKAYDDICSMCREAKSRYDEQKRMMELVEQISKMPREVALDLVIRVLERIRQ